MARPVTPLLAVDIIIEIQDWFPIRFTFPPSDPVRQDGIVLIERKNEPKGWALPGGMVDVGETCIAAAHREAEEETGLVIVGTRLLGMYDDPKRDPRGHTVGLVYVAQAVGVPQGRDDAIDAIIVDPEQMGEYRDKLCFDHKQIITDYLVKKRKGEI